MSRRTREEDQMIINEVPAVQKAYSAVYFAVKAEGIPLKIVPQ